MSGPLPAGIEIVEAGPDDLPAIAGLAAVIWRAHYPGILSEAQIDYMLARMYALAAMEAEMAGQGVRYERLLAGGKLVGFAAFGSAATAGLCKLHKLYLRPDHHGLGLGRRLLGHCAEQARQSGASRMRLQVNKRNTSAVEMYHRNGFRIVAETVDDIGGGFVMDDFIMEKNLVGPEG